MFVCSRALLLEQLQAPALKELAEQQVRFAPPAKRLEQLARAEKLLAEIDPARQYPYQFVCFRVTEFRSDAYPDLLIRGDERTAFDRNRQRALAERGTDMGGHVIRSFGGVTVIPSARRETIEGVHEIAQHVRVGIFLDQQ